MSPQNFHNESLLWLHLVYYILSSCNLTHLTLVMDATVSVLFQFIKHNNNNKTNQGTAWARRGHLIWKAIVLCYQACGQRQTTNEVHKVADGATSGFEFSMEIYGDDDNMTAIQDHQHKKKFIHLQVEFLECIFKSFLLVLEMWRLVPWKLKEKK